MRLITFLLLLPENKSKRVRQLNEEIAKVFLRYAFFLGFHE